MIRYGNSGIEDVKFGNQQVSKVYHGADLVWEKDDYTPLQIGDNFIVTDFATTGSAGRKEDCGFILNAQASGIVISGVFDGSINTGALFASTSNNSNNSVAHIMIGFPFPVLLQSVTIIDCDDDANGGNCIQYGGSTDISGKQGFQKGKVYFSTVAETGFFAGSDNAPANTLDSNGRGTYFTISSRTGYTRSVCRNSNWNNTEVRAVDLKITEWKKSMTKQYEAEMKLDVLVKTSDYNAWKRQYASDLANARNGAGARIV